MESLTIFSKKLFELRFTRYFVSGVFAFLIDNLTLNFVKFVLKQEFLVLGVLAFPKLVSSIVGSFITFYLNRNWTFNDSKQGVAKHGGKFILSYVFGILFATLLYTIYYFILTEIGFSSALAATSANFASEGTKMFVNFFVYKLFVFK